jgi:UrcA family protein
MTSITSQNKRLTRAGIAAFAVSACLIAYNAAAADVQVKTQRVSYADLDLSKAAGAQTLYKRIKAAARHVCGPVDQYTFVTPPSTFRACFQQAVADAVAQVDRPSLTALHTEATRTARG